MGSQFIKLLDDGAFDGPPFEFDALRRKSLSRPSASELQFPQPIHPEARTVQVAIDRFSIQFLRSEEIDIDHESSVSRSEQSRNELVSEKPTFFHNYFRALVGIS